MSLITLYPALKAAHLALVATSATLFAIRGAAVLAGQAWPMRRPWRVLSYAIDTLLLAAGMALWVALSLNPVHQPWLGVKLLLLLAYIGLGTLALKRARTAGVRRGSYLAALLTLAFMATVAVTHSPWGLLSRWAP